MRGITPNRIGGAMTDTKIYEGMEHLRAAAQCFEISPEHYYRATVDAKPNSDAGRAADAEIVAMDLRAEPGWTDPRPEGQCG